MKFNFKPDDVFVYLRVSTKKQVDEDGGLGEQNKICSDYLKENFPKCKSSDYYSEVGSSYNNKNKLCQLEKIKRNIGENSLIVIRDISRLGRNVFQVFCLLRKIKKTNSHIISINDELCYNYSNLMDKEFFHKVIDSEKDSDLKSINSKKIISRIKNLGGHIGKGFYGTIVIKKNNIPYLFKNPEEIKIIKLIAEKFISFKNITEIRTFLNDNKIKARNGKLWKNISVKNIINKYYPELLSNKKNLNYDMILNKEILKELNNPNNEDVEIIKQLEQKLNRFNIV